MYKILNSSGLGVAGKQNELIELALTHGFNGVEVDMVDLVGRHDTMGKQFACQFLQSAKIDLGTFLLPLDLGAEDEQYNESLSHLDTIIDLATTLNSKCCYVKIATSNGHFSFQECFDKHEERLRELSDKFSESGIRIGLALSPAPAEVADGEFKFIQTPDELLKMVKSVGQSNVGVFLDCWQWAASGGTVEQLVAEGIDKTATEVRLADVAPAPEGSEIAGRTALPGDSLDSFSVELCKALIASGTETPISVSTDLSTFANGPRNSIVGKMSKQLDLLIAGQHPAELAQAAAAAEDAEANPEAEEETEAKTEDEPVVAAAE